MVERRDFTPVASVAISTDAFPEKKRLALWREMYGLPFLNVEVDPIGDAPFQTNLALTVLPGVRIAAGSRSPSCYRRTRELAANAKDDDVVLSVIRSGTGMASQLGREVVCESGAGMLTLATEPALGVLRGHALAQGSGVNMTFSRSALAPLVKDLGGACVRPIPAQNQALQLLMKYVDIVQAAGNFATPGLVDAAVTHIVDLAALAIGATRDFSEIARERGGRAARLEAIKSDIIGGLSRPRLNRDMIAARHRITPRYVGKLFEEEGTSFSEFVLRQRLERARQMLAAPGHEGSSVVHIAFECGFGDLSYFNRTFRRAYGATPSDLRETARRQRVGGAVIASSMG
jgi:AraC-like DNA-binding protein